MQNQQGPDFMTSLARGLSVLRAFADDGPPMTIAEASRRTGIGRSAVRRCLYTLTSLRYVDQVGSAYLIRPEVLSLAHSYLSSDPLIRVAQPILDQLRDDIGQSCSLGSRQGDDLIYLARSSIRSIFSINLNVGSKLPLYCTSMGRILLSDLSDDDIMCYLIRAEIRKYTTKTITNIDELLQTIKDVRADGFSVVDQELEFGLRSIAAPVLNSRRKIVAAINVGTHADRVDRIELRSTILPRLRQATQSLSQCGVWAA